MSIKENNWQIKESCFAEKQYLDETIRKQFKGEDTIKIISTNMLIIEMPKFQKIDCQTFDYNGLQQSQTSKRLYNPMIKFQSTAFHNLKELSITNSQMETIQPIGNLDMPNIKKLNFRGNQITEVSPLCNLFADDIESINLDANNDLFTIEALVEGDWPNL